MGDYIPGLEEKLSKSGHKPDILKNIEYEIRLSPKEAVERIVSKNPNGLCNVLDNGKIREGVMLSFRSNGSITVGIFKEKS